jgi:hypothetical protein
VEGREGGMGGWAVASERARGRGKKGGGREAGRESDGGMERERKGERPAEFGGALCESLPDIDSQSTCTFTHTLTHTHTHTHTRVYVCVYF